MDSDKPVNWLGRRKERKAVKLSVDHAAEVLQAVIGMNETVQSFNKGPDDLVERIDRVFDKEREADKVKEEITTELSEGAYLPPSRGHLLRLITTADDIADNARAAAAKLEFLEPGEVDGDISNGLAQLAYLSQECVKPLKRAFTLLFEKENVKESIGETEKVEKMEEKIDYFRANNLIPKIVEWADRSHRPGMTILITQIEENIEEVADQAENTADTIREIALGSA
ncbi:hypothetical protein AKJ38_01235 [candidate division MSBL1 archaeon SCGC-AAA259I14]|uniref:Phosphate transport regulator n=1 Tax=candidate division MSBL1 archaeon SCGC-AAA259I14 TaxID=1698268 RepID=A0A133UT71_9EURY|nr:hypothetical protein AKJ38_01235 [candidate division MSBL1 archaeon SCGC-AAA259I14]